MFRKFRNEAHRWLLHTYHHWRRVGGCLLANRLSARADNHVLVLEAGDWDRNFWLKLPVGYFRSINNPSVSRHFATTPGEGTADRSIDWPRGKVVGGASRFNGLFFLRGQ